MTPRFKPNAFHIELCEFLRMFGWATGQQAALWTGAHGSTVKKALYRMKADEVGLVQRSTVTTYTTASGAARVADLAVVSVWHLTKRGLRLLGPIDELPGSGARLVSLPVIRSVGQSATIQHHLSSVDHAIALRIASGARVVSERQIRATETEVAKRSLRDTDETLRANRHWVAISGTWQAGDAPELLIERGGAISHTPDVGAQWDDRFAVRGEVELARKDLKTYRRDLHAMYGSDSVPAQWWFPAQAGARKLLIEAAGQIAPGGIVEVDGRPAWWASHDDRIRVYPKLWFGGFNTVDLATFDPRAAYATMLNPRTGRRDAEAQIDPRRFWLTRPDIAGVGENEDGTPRLSLAQRTKAARACGHATAPERTEATSPVVVLPSLTERTALVRSASEQALAAALTPGSYRLGEGLVADWDGTVFANLRAA